LQDLDLVFKSPKVSKTKVARIKAKRLRRGEPWQPLFLNLYLNCIKLKTVKLQTFFKNYTQCFQRFWRFSRGAGLDSFSGLGDRTPFGDGRKKSKCKSYIAGRGGKAAEVGEGGTGAFQQQTPSGSFDYAQDDGQKEKARTNRIHDSLFTASCLTHRKRVDMFIRFREFREPACLDGTISSQKVSVCEPATPSSLGKQ
jgi:hypothetical protein